MKNKKFEITIEETVSDTFTVIAENAKEAMKIAVDKYNTSEFVLEPGFLVAKQMAITSLNHEEMEWIEF